MILSRHDCRFQKAMQTLSIKNSDGSIAIHSSSVMLDGSWRSTKDPHKQQQGLKASKKKVFPLKMMVNGEHCIFVSIFEIHQKMRETSPLA
jgi:hypothetical protein